MAARCFIPGAMMLAMAAIGVLNYVARAVAPKPFDEWYEDCQPEDANWKLVVELGVPGQRELPPYEAYFRKRSSALFATRPWPFNSGPQFIEFEVLYGGSMWSSFGCCAGECGEGGYSEFGRTSQLKTRDGIELEVSYESAGTPDRNLQVEESIVIPFRQDQAGQQNQLTYQATWQRLK
jgi:hypothetical protein